MIFQIVKETVVNSCFSCYITVSGKGVFMKITEIKDQLMRFGRFLKERSEKIPGFFSLSKGEVLYLALMYFLLLVFNYFIIALHGFSLSYSKVFPGIGCLDEIVFLQLLLKTGHFLCLRSRWYLWGVVTIHFLVLTGLLGIYLTTGTFFCESILYLVYDTTWEETKGFFSAYVSWKSLLILTGILLVYFVPMHFAGKLCSMRKKYCRGDLFSIIFLLLLFLPFLIRIILELPRENRTCSAVSERIQAIHPFSRIREQIRMFHAHAGAFTLEMRHRKAPESVILQPALEKQPPVGVLVIGESAIRSHHSIYGYSRNTTPNLMRYRKEIAAFDDVIAVLPMTITALKYWLTDMTLENRHVKWTIFDVLQKAGYRVDVITNQNKSGWADSPLQMIFSSAESIHYMHEENFSDLAEDADAKIYDENLLPHFQKWIRENRENPSAKPRLLVVHLFGSHEPYRSRYPEGFAPELQNDPAYPARVNEYDSSIRYSDRILGNILDALSQLKQPSFMIYLSDHGSVCETSNLRTPNSVENSAYEIPFLIWTNQKYRTVLPEISVRMKKSEHVPLQADMAHAGLLEMMGVILPEEPETGNFLSGKFQAPPRTVNEGRQPYRKRPDQE